MLEPPFTLGLDRLPAPLLFKDAKAGGGMLAHVLHVELEPDSGSVGERNVPILDDRARAVGSEHIAVPDLALLQRMPLENEEVWNGRADMGGCHGAQRLRYEMRRERQIVNLGEVGDLLALREPAAFGHVRHDD